MAIDKVANIRMLLDAYGIGVRGGVITPNLADENAFRKMMGLAPANKDVVAQWKRTDGVRLPVTLQRGLADVAAEQPNQGGDDGEQAEN